MLKDGQPNTRAVTLAFHPDSEGEPRCYAAHLGSLVDGKGAHPIWRFRQMMDPTRQFEFVINMTDTAPDDLRGLPGDTYVVVAILTDHDYNERLVGFYNSVGENAPDTFRSSVNSASAHGDVTEHVIALDSARLAAAFEPDGLNGDVASVAA